MFFVMYMYEGEYHLVSKQVFNSAEEAQAYADGVDPQFKAFVTGTLNNL